MKVAEDNKHVSLLLFAAGESPYPVPDPSLFPDYSVSDFIKFEDVKLQLKMAGPGFPRGGMRCQRILSTQKESGRLFFMLNFHTHLWIWVSITRSVRVFIDS